MRRRKSGRQRRGTPIKRPQTGDPETPPKDAEEPRRGDAAVREAGLYELTPSPARTHDGPVYELTPSPVRLSGDGALAGEGPPRERGPDAGAGNSPRSTAGADAAKEEGKKPEVFSKLSLALDVVQPGSRDDDETSTPRFAGASQDGSPDHQKPFRAYCEAQGFD